MKYKDWVGNANSLYKIIGASNHTDKEREQNDFYATEPITIDKLSKVFEIPKFIIEISAGNGHLSERLKELGHTVISNDIIERDYKLDTISDFLEWKNIPDNFSILTNPPYKYAKEFVLKSLDLLHRGGYCIMLLKLTFLEGKQRYKELFSKYPPKYLYVFSERVLCAKNGMFEQMRESGGSAVAYGWFIWEKGCTDETIIRWL